MKNDVCFVCSGQCAGNIGVLFEQLGYNVLYINTAKSDLDTLLGATHVWQIPDERGCNQDQMKAKEILSRRAPEILQQIDKFAFKRIVYFVASAGGGTGGGITPLLLEIYLEHLRETEDFEWKLHETNENLTDIPIHRKAGLITVLPSLKESVQINANAYNFMHDINTLFTTTSKQENTNLANVFLIDNENCADYLSLNTKFVTLFHSILNIPYKHKSLMGNVDEADLENTITFPGVCILAQVPKDNFDTRKLLNAISESDIFSQSEGKTSIFWVTSTVDAVDSLALEKELGIPKAHYTTFNSECNYAVVSGLGLPTERIALLAERAKEFKESAIKNHAETSSISLNEDLNFLNMCDSEESGIPIQPIEQISIADKLGKFRRRR